MDALTKAGWLAALLAPALLIVSAFVILPLASAFLYSLYSWNGLARGAFAEVKRRTDYAEVGGAPLLGVKGVSIIAHGRSHGRALKSAIRIASIYVCTCC